MSRTTKAATAAAFAAVIGVVGAAPAQAMEIYNISNATRLAEGAAVEGTYTVSCTEGTSIMVSLSVTQRVTGGHIANGHYSNQWICEGGEVTLPYQSVAYNMAFDEGPAVVSGYIQECAAVNPYCGPGTNLPLVVIEVTD